MAVYDAIKVKFEFGKEKEMLFRLAEKEETEAVYALYQSVIGQLYCTWNELYPGRNEILRDLETGNLFLLEENGAVIGAASVVPENEMDELPCWTVKENASEIARIVIHPTWQGKGYAEILVSKILAELRCRNCAWVHLSVAALNLPAFKTYQKLGFSTVGEKDMYGNQYYLCEKIL